MVISGEQPSEWLDYFDLMDSEVYQMLAPWDVWSDDVLRQHFGRVAPNLLAYWRLYQALRNGTNRHMYRCLTRLVNPYVESFMSHGIAQDYQVQTILEVIDNGNVDDQAAYGIVHAHLQTALIVSAIDRSHFAIFHECTARLEELKQMLAQTEVALCAHAPLFQINYECRGIRQLLKPSARKIPFLLPVIHALSHK